MLYEEVDDWKEILGWRKKETDREMEEMDMIGDNNEKDRLIEEESKKNKEEDIYRERFKMIDREIEQMNMIRDLNEKDKVINKNLNDLIVVEKELRGARDMMKVEINIMEAERKIKKLRGRNLNLTMKKKKELEKFGKV